MSSMNERRLSPFMRSILYFFRSLKPIYWKPPKPTQVGVDHLGNKYFEVPPDPARRKTVAIRTYTSPGMLDDLDRQLPAEWQAWLRMRRRDPPSEEEQERMRIRAAHIEAKKLANESLNPLPKDGGFPKLPEYEEIPGNKYKN